jgi:ABC-2 type transport system permease protein
MSAQTGVNEPSRGRRSAGLPSVAALCASRTGLELRQFFRERDTVIFIFAFPVMMLGIFSVVCWSRGRRR